MRAISIFSWTGLILNGFFLKLLTRRYIFQLTKYKHKGISKSINFDDANVCSVGRAESLFLKRFQL